MAKGSKLATGVLAGALALTASTPADAVDAKSAALQLFAITNIDRTSNGRSALKHDPRLDTISVARSDDMIKRDYFSHQIPPNNTTVADIGESLGVQFQSVGENIAWNNSNDFQTVGGAAQDFEQSPHHRENLLDPRWDRMGTGVAEGGPQGRKMYTVVFMQLPPAAPGARPSGPKASQGPAAATRVQGERVEVASTRTGLLTTLVNSVVRLFLQQ